MRLSETVSRGVVRLSGPTGHTIRVRFCRRGNYRCDNLNAGHLLSGPLGDLCFTPSRGFQNTKIFGTPTNRRRTTSRVTTGANDASVHRRVLRTPSKQRTPPHLSAAQRPSPERQPCDPNVSCGTPFSPAGRRCEGRNSCCRAFSTSLSLRGHEDLSEPDDTERLVFQNP